MENRVVIITINCRHLWIVGQCTNYELIAAVGYRKDTGYTFAVCDQYFIRRTPLALIRYKTRSMPYTRATQETLKPYKCFFVELY